MSGFTGLVAVGLVAVPSLATAQTTLDRVDPAKIEQRSAPPVGKPVHNVPLATPSVVTPPPTASAPITVGAITVIGLEKTRPSDFADIFEIYAGRTLSPAALAGLADAIADRLHDRGYVFATAAILPQRLDAGLLRVTVDEGRIDAVRLQGGDNAAVRAALAPLVGTGPVKLDEVERRLLIAGDVDGLWIKRTRFVREKGRNILVLDLGRDRISGVLGLDDYGSRPIGPLEADATVRIAQVFSSADLLTLSGVFTPAEPREFAYGRARYSRRVSRDGTELSASFSYSEAHPGSYLTSRDITGKSWTGELGLLQPLVRRRVESLWFNASFSVRTVRQDYAGELARRDRLSVLRFGVYGFTSLWGGRLRADATLSQGLDLFNATRLGDPLASRPRAYARFTSVATSVDWTGPLTGRWSAQVAVTTQIASRPLLVSEQVGLGGGRFLRGYDYSERTGDEGVMESSELRYALPDKVGFATKPVLYGFVDGGHVINLRGGIGGTLFSAGGGVRTGLGARMSADVGVAFPLSGPRYDSGDANPVFNFRLTRRF